MIRGEQRSTETVALDYTSGVPDKGSKMGRPPRAKKPAEVRFELRLTADESRRWAAAAKRSKLRMAALVRAAVEAFIK